MENLLGCPTIFWNSELNPNKDNQSNGGDESISSTEEIEDAILPLGGLIDLIPPARRRRRQNQPGGHLQSHHRSHPLFSTYQSD
ncbi:hypothetical protein DsansV1_C26g0195611 [Dioscorea sansibarensis]